MLRMSLAPLVVKPRQYPKMETALVAWMHEARAAIMSLSGTLIKIKAKTHM